MKNLKALTDSELLESTNAAISDERRISIEVLWHLREIENRRLFCGHPSLFEYCVHELKYSKGPAYRRIAAMRALKDVPEISTAIQSGELTMTTVAQVQSFIRQEKIQSDRVYSTEEKKALFSEFAGKSSDQVEKELSAKAPNLIPREKTRSIDENKTELRIVLNDSTMEKLKQVQNLCAHKLQDPNSYAELLNLMADQTLAKIDPRKQKQSVSVAKVDPIVKEIRDKAKPPTRYIAKNLKIETWKKAKGRCNYKDPVTGHVCNSQFKLQIEHIHPFAKGGANELDNLTLLCSAHQQVLAIQEFGLIKMKRYVKSLRT